MISMLWTAAFAAAAAGPGCNTGDRSVALILDASGSMQAKLPGGEARIVAAQKAVSAVAAMVDPKAQLALRIYGASSPAREKNCEDSKVAVPFAAAGTQAQAIAKALEGVKAQGYTPIAYSLEQAAKEFPAGKERAIVLVSDGKETCKGDPVLAARSLAGQGITVHTIGFVVDSAAKMQLQAVARATGGTYFDAPQGSELPETLKSAINACKMKPPQMKTAKSNPGKLRTTSAMWLATHEVINVETGQKAGTLDSGSKEVKLPPGIYEVRFGPATWKGIEVRAGETTTISPAVLKVSKNISASLVDSETDARHGSFDAVTSSATVMPGVYDLVWSSGLRWPYLKLDGDKTLQLDPVEFKLGRDLRGKKVRILSDGKEVAAFDAVTSRHTLPPGEYVVEVDGKPRPFTGKGGETLEITP